jgi:TnpA family transposase
VNESVFSVWKVTKILNRFGATTEIVVRMPKRPERRYSDLLKRAYLGFLFRCYSDPETEAILRRFTRNNIQHPTYKAFAELGKAVKTIFLCRYLHSETLRREINEGLNVIEQWNGATDFVFFARRGEMTSNRREDHEISMLALHLLQNCMVYINTLMLQQVLAQPHWRGRLGPRDLRALTPLIWEHVNPYGRFELDMDARLPLD